ncbi:DMT family transporter [Caldibacillus lycopersici]|uniref:DMT family transporter n=1 Tax=Perspicuibacillus lycopersici TaxID=1325689 RepID=A0AAE3IU71_9BACI|nr:DMT family transporter [Perspicuibacillus lycopersici]MCU9614705.1 DMT family transporter [Perspicuibacillus lycopersici]
MLAALLGIGIGFGLAVQTAINSQLRKFVVSPFLASMISFLIGTIFLLLSIVISGSPLAVPFSIFTSQPIWIWIGGFCGVCALTSNILLFPKLGSVQTTVMPILGMIVMGMLIDHFGWFYASKHTFGWNRIVGVIFVLLGVFLAIVVQEIITKRQQENPTTNENSANKWIWRIVGICAGMLMSIQAAVNGQLGVVLGSPFQAAFVSFFVGSITLIIIVGIKDRNYKNIVEPIKQSAPWWVWLGGIIGGIYVLANVFLVDQIGTGQTVVLALFGQIAGSLIVEQFGLLKSTKNRITAIQIVGLICMLAGVFLIKTF